MPGLARAISFARDLERMAAPGEWARRALDVLVERPFVSGSGDHAGRPRKARNRHWCSWGMTNLLTLPAPGQIRECCPRLAGLLTGLLLAGIALGFAVLSWIVLVDPWLTIVTCVPPVGAQTWLGAHIDFSAAVDECLGSASGVAVPKTMPGAVGISLLVTCPILAVNAVLVLSTTGAGAFLARLARAVRSALHHAFSRLPHTPSPMLRDRTSQYVDVPVPHWMGAIGGLPCHPRRGPPLTLAV